MSTAPGPTEASPTDLQGAIESAPTTVPVPWWRRIWRNRTARWLMALGAVLTLITVTVSVFVGTAGAQRADDPRSHTSTGAAALAQLLSDEGVQISATERVDEAARLTNASTTMVVANADRLSRSQARQLMDATPGRLVLIRANTPALQAFDLPVSAQSPAEDVLAPRCADPGAQRAGGISIADLRASYRATGAAELACYPSGSGYAHLRVRTATGSVDLVAGGLANRTLPEAGNASFAMTLLGSQPKIVWLMPARQTDVGSGDSPTLLPPWWELAVVQALLAVVVLGVWRGPRLGPIMTEALPVTVRASETVEGHGRLYYKLGARDHAAEVLRLGARDRLRQAFGQDHDPGGLSAVLAARTGRDERSIRSLLFCPAPETDAELTALAQHLDQLEQEARRL